MRSLPGMLCAALLAVLLNQDAAASVVGPEWIETDDAGKLPGGAQSTIGVGPLGAIRGSLTSTLLGGDFEDMYVIMIDSPASFSAVVAPVADGITDFDVALWLLGPVSFAGEPAFGLLGNDDAPGAPMGESAIFPLADDGSGAAVQEAGLYYIAVTRSGNVPLSVSGAIFDFMAPTEISGPDGSGGGDIISDWSGDPLGTPGNYRILLNGVSFADVPAPGVLAVLALGAVGLRRRRR